jgi:hypothetical protein
MSRWCVGELVVRCGRVPGGAVDDDERRRPLTNLPGSTLRERSSTGVSRGHRTGEEAALGDYPRPKHWERRAGRHSYSRHYPARRRQNTRCGRRSWPKPRSSPAPHGLGPWIALGTSDLVRVLGRPANRTPDCCRGRRGRYLRPAPNRPDPNRQTPAQSLLTRRFLVLGCGWRSCCVSFAHRGLPRPTA